VIETVKRAEDGKGLIVRLYEAQRIRGTINVKTAFPIKEAHRVNLLEERQSKLQVNGNAVEYAIRPYEIVTLRITPA
jgi:alpha-mannosidase